MTKPAEAIGRYYPEIGSERLVGSISGRWVGTPDNSEKNQVGSIVMTDAAAYVYKKGSLLNQERGYRIPMTAAQFEIKQNPFDRSGQTKIMWLDEVPDAEDQQTYREALARDDIQTVTRVRKSGHRFLIVEREVRELQMLVQQTIALWRQNHEWREAGFASRPEFDRALNADGSSIPLNRKEMECARVWIQEEGMSRQEAQGRILDEREVAD